jgi:hypothetical protein
MSPMIAARTAAPITQRSMFEGMLFNFPESAYRKRVPGNRTQSGLVVVLLGVTRGMELSRVFHS